MKSYYYFFEIFLGGAAILSCLQMIAFVRINHDAKEVSDIEDLMLRATVPMMKRQSTSRNLGGRNDNNENHHYATHEMDRDNTDRRYDLKQQEQQQYSENNWISRMEKTAKLDPCSLESLLSEGLSQQQQQYASSRRQLQQKQKRKTTRPCAILFFGLARKFRDIVYPSIQEQVLPQNEKCDLFVHTYSDGTSLKEMRTRGRRSGVILYDPLEVYDMTSNVVVDSIEDWELHSGKNWTYYMQSKYIPSLMALEWDVNAVTTMYRQWYSIERVWDLMEGYENLLNIEYDYVGLLRNDVKYRSPIQNLTELSTNSSNNNSTQQNQKGAIIPNFGNIINDRMFLGTRSNAKIWSKIRFPAIDNDCYKPKKEGYGLHGEYFMKDYILQQIPDVVTKDDDICFYRISANGNLRGADCWS